MKSLICSVSRRLSIVFVMVVCGVGYPGDSFCQNVSPRETSAVDWPQGSGVNGDFRTLDAAPTKWSVARNENIAWKVSLPETGQSPVTVVGDRAFFSIMSPVDGDSEYGTDIQAWCCNANTGKILWKHDLPGRFPSRLSGCFGDNSSVAPVSTGNEVIFLNPFGEIRCFGIDGQLLWSKQTLSVARTVPFLYDGLYVFTRQIYEPEKNGSFSHAHSKLSREHWTQLAALKADTGEQVWKTNCGVNMGCTITPQKLADGRTVAVVGRGGGHGPPENPDGVSMVDLSDGSTVWSIPLDGFMGTMSYLIRNDVLHFFHGTEHLSVDAMSGKITKRVSITTDVPVLKWNGSERIAQTETIAGNGKSKRFITQNSNLLVDKYHYFRSYLRPYLGRVHVESGRVEYLELPLQVSRAKDRDDQFGWFPSKVDDSKEIVADGNSSKGNSQKGNRKRGKRPRGKRPRGKARTCRRWRRRA